MSKHFTDIKSKILPDSEVEITGSIIVEFINECRIEALKELNQKVSFDGFRKGHIPEDVLVKRLGEMAILEESAEIALGKEIYEIIKETKVQAIGRPIVVITKLALNVPLEFKITIAVEPEFKLPDYKKISKEIFEKEEKIEIIDKEVDDVLREIKEHNLNPDLKEGEDLNTKIKENLLMEKTLRAKEQKRQTVLEKMISMTEVVVPKILVQAELDRMMSQFMDEVTRAGLKWEEYLKTLKKTEAEVKAEWQDKALERAKAELLVSKIAIEEKIEPAEAELEHEVKHILEHYPEADPLRVRIYLFTQMRNQKVFEFLENIDKNVK
jgi:FKBP-type peptidyl-prolyl cis-trans isomerase (trigger factor)